MLEALVVLAILILIPLLILRLLLGLVFGLVALPFKLLGGVFRLGTGLVGLVLKLGVGLVGLVFGALLLAGVAVLVPVLPLLLVAAGGWLLWRTVRARPALRRTAA